MISKLFYEKPVSIDEKQKLIDLCKEIVTNDLALVSVEIASKSMMRSVRDRRITVMGQIASLGNIVTILRGPECEYCKIHLE